MSNRATGKTFRAVLSALKFASDGEQVLFVCRNYLQRRFIFARCVETMELFGVDLITSRRMYNSIKFTPNNGSIRFVDVTIPYNIRGCSFDKIINDSDSVLDPEINIVLRKQSSTGSYSYVDTSKESP